MCVSRDMDDQSGTIFQHSSRPQLCVCCSSLGLPSPPHQHHQSCLPPLQLNFSAPLPSVLLMRGRRLRLPGSSSSFSLRDGTLFLFPLPFFAALLFLSAPTFQPTPSHLCANSSQKCCRPASLLFLSRTQTWTHFSVVTFSGSVLLAHYYYAVLYKHLNENRSGLLCLLDRPVLCCVFPLFPVFSFSHFRE